MRSVLHVPREAAVRPEPGTRGAVENQVPRPAPVARAGTRIYLLVVRLLPRRGRPVATGRVADHPRHAAPHVSDPHETPRPDSPLPAGRLGRGLSERLAHDHG